MDKFWVGVIAFAAGAVVGALAVKEYVQAHAAEITAQKIGESLFGADSQVTKILTGIGSTADQVRA